MPSPRTPSLPMNEVVCTPHATSLAPFPPENLLPPNSKPRNAAQRCQLTPALLLRGLLVGFGGTPVHGLEHPWVFAKPLPAPVETRTPGHGQGFSQVRVRVALENARLPMPFPNCDRHRIEIMISLERGEAGWR